MKVSIVMTAYNYGRFIEEAVYSVLRQTHPDFELIIVDDGSTDDTSDRVRPFTDSRVRCIRTENQGVVKARNTALDLATGDILASLDADDRWHPTMLERQAGLFRSEPDVVAAFTNFRRFDNSGQIFPHDQFTFYPGLKSFSARPARCGHGHVLLGDSFQSFLEATDSPGFPTAIAFRRSSVLDLRYDLDRGIWPVEDMQYMFRAFLRGIVAYNPEPLADLRRHGTNATADLGVIPLGKLRSFESLEREELTPDQRATLLERVVRARFDLARAHAAAREWRRSVSVTLDALRKPGRLPRKLRGMASVALSVGRNLVGSRAGLK